MSIDRSPTTAARRSLRRISWRSFLSSVARYSSQSPDGSADNRTHVLGLANDVPTLVLRSQRVIERREGGISRPQSAQVDDVPGLIAVCSVGRLGQRLGHRGSHRRQVVRIGQKRRVVGVIAGAEEDRLGVVGDLASGRSMPAQDGSVDDVARLDLVAMHQRRDRARQLPVDLRPAAERDHRRDTRACASSP